MIDDQTTEQPQYLPKDDAIGYTPGRMSLPSVAGMPTYPHDWPEWAKDSAFAYEVTLGHYRRGTCDQAAGDPDFRGMMAEVVLGHIDAMRAIALPPTGKPGEPATRYEAAARYAKKTTGITLDEMHKWATNERANVIRIRWERLQKAKGLTSDRRKGGRGNVKPVAQQNNQTRGDWE